MSQITTHILDIAKGKPAANVAIVLEQKTKNGWLSIAKGSTNADGRIADLLPKETVLSEGTYKLIFDVAPYFKAQKVVFFYPSVEIQFLIHDTAHYHVPLLLSQFGYSTYRGS